MEKTEKLELFQNKIKDIYGLDLGLTILDEIKKIPPVCFRVNTLKARVEEVLSRLKDLGFEFCEGLLPNSFYLLNKSGLNISEEIALSRISLFDDGLIYIQNFSSMLPSIILETKTGDKVLDLCASPGSKTAHLASLNNNEISITAVENNVNRFNSLKRNCENQGVKNIEFLKLNAQDFCSKRPQYINYFERVLCDVPCSNEGLIRNPGTYDFKYWNTKNARNLSVLQKKIISNGILALKNGGTLVYSTCTYSPEENEQVIDWALRKFPDINITEINSINIQAVPGLKNWKNKTFSETISRSLRILPNNLYEGFFIAKLVKK